MAPPVFKTAWAAVRLPEGSTPFLLRQRDPIVAGDLWLGDPPSSASVHAVNVPQFAIG